MNDHQNQPEAPPQDVCQAYGREYGRREGVMSLGAGTAVGYDGPVLLAFVHPDHLADFPREFQGWPIAVFAQSEPDRPL